MRIVIPIWDDKVSPVFDAASRLLIVETESRNIVSRFEIYLDEQDLSRRFFRIQYMAIDILICGAISHAFSRMLMASGVEVIPEISGQTEEVLKVYFQGELFNPKFLMPGCKRSRSSRKNRSSPIKQSRRQQGKKRAHGQGGIHWIKRRKIIMEN